MEKQNYDEIISYAKKYGIPIMRKRTSEIIETFVKKNKPKNILEIGTAIGYSGLIMLENTKAKLITIEHNEGYIKIAKQNFKKYNQTRNVKIINDDCLVALVNLVSNEKYLGFFDLIFLDGPKAQYDKMLELIILLLKEKGTLIVDDVLFHGQIDDESAKQKRFKTISTRMKYFIEKCKNHQKFSYFCLNEVDDGIIFATKG